MNAPVMDPNMYETDERTESFKNAFDQFAGGRQD